MNSNTATIALAAIILVPVILLMFFKINAALVYLSVCLGNVLVQFVAPDAQQFVSLFSAHVPKGIDTGDTFIKLMLLFLPVILTAIFMIKTVHGKGKLFINLLPAIGTGLLICLLITPLLHDSLSTSVLQTELWRQLQMSQDLIIGVSSLFCLMALWLQRPKTGNKKEKKGKGKKD
jgi:hypothetical protein